MSGRCSAELRHRWLTRAGIALLLVVSIAPLSGKVGAATAPFVDGCRQLLAQCALVLRATGAPLRWLPVALLALGLAYAVSDRIRLSLRVRRFLGVQRRRRAMPGEAILREAAVLGIGRHVRVLVGTSSNPAFTAGVWQPRIYIAEELQHVLSPFELRAVVRHESYHLTHRDPLRFAILRFAARTFFWLPLIRVLVDALMDDTELLADDFATRTGSGSDPLDVASALMKIGQMRHGVGSSPAGIPGIGGFRLLERRIRRLADARVGDGLGRLQISPRHVMVTLGGIMAVWLSSTFTPAASQHGMTMQLGDRCPHAMDALHRHCPECTRHPGRMQNCPE